MGCTLFGILRKIPMPDPPPDFGPLDRQFFESTFRLAAEVPGVLSRRTAQVTGAIGGRQTQYAYVAEMEFENHAAAARALESPQGQALLADIKKLPAQVTLLQADRVLDPPFNSQRSHKAGSGFTHAADLLDEAAFHYRLATVAAERGDRAGANQHAARAREIAQGALERGAQAGG